MSIKGTSLRSQVAALAVLPLEEASTKEEWLAFARASFTPSERLPCKVCGKYRGLTHAHHVVPLATQYRLGLKQPDHSHVWLCPTQHAAIHILIGQKLARRIGASSATIKSINGLVETGELEGVLDLFVNFGLSLADLELEAMGVRI